MEFDEKNLLRKNDEHALENQETEFEQYIMGTLMYVPKFYIKTRQQYIDMRVYGKGQNQPSMKIFRMMSHYILDENNPGAREVGFQDEVNTIDESGEMNYNVRWQVNFSAMFDVDTDTFIAIKEKPKADTLHDGLKESVLVFKRLSQEEGATFYAGDQKYVSDGTTWVPVDRSGNKMLPEKIDSVLPDNTNEKF